MIEVFSSGGGTQSTAIAVLIIQGRLPRPDFICIADTGREMPTTWTYLNEVTIPKLKAIGLDVFRVGKEYCSDAAKDVFHQSGAILIPAFSNQGGASSKLSSFCSNEWKVRVVNRYLKQVHGIDRKEYKKWIGFSFDETNRILRMQSGFEYKAGLIRFPLVEIPTRRHEAIRIVEKAGWPKPPRSRCFDCPNQSDKEWFEVKKDFPSLFQSAIERDEYIRTRDAHAFLHSTITPLKDVDLSQEDDLFSDTKGCSSGECFL